MVAAARDIGRDTDALEGTGASGACTNLPAVAGHTIEDVTASGFPAVALDSGDGGLRATVVPGLAMLVCSLRHRGVELLGQRRGVTAYARTGSTMGIPFLYPWANRLGGAAIRIDGREVALDAASPLLRLDENGLPIHGVRSAGRGWEVVDRGADAGGARVAATLDWSADADLMAAFPVAHAVTVSVRLEGPELSVAVSVTAGGAPAPLAFGFHPYLRLPGVPRAEWFLEAPVARRAVLDARGIPTGDEEAVEPIAEPLGTTAYDDLYPALQDPPRFALSGGSRRIEVAFGEGFPVAQLFAPLTDDVVAIEPMAAPTDALGTGAAPEVAAGRTATARFAIRVS